MASTDAKPIPLKNTAYRVTFAIFDADGDFVTGAAGLDSEVSLDAGTFSDCTNEATEIATSSGMYYLDLTSGEMNADTVAVIIKTSTSGAKTTPIVMYPAESTDIPVNVTAISGDATAADNAEAFFDGTGYAGTNNVMPTTTTVTNMVTANVTQISGDSVAADNLEAATDGGSYNVGGGAVVAASVTGAVGSVTGAVGSVTGAVGSVTGNVGGNVAGSVGSVTGAVGSVTGNVGGNVTGSVGSVASGGITAASIATGAIDADSLAADAGAEIADAVWDEARASHVAAGSFGEGVASVQGNVTGNVAGSVASVTGAVGSVTGNVGGNVTGSVGSVVGAVGSVTGAVGSVTGAVGSVTGNVGGNVTGSVGSVAAGGITAASVATGAIDADALATDAVAEIADGVWDEAIAGHVGAGSTGAALNAATAPSAATVADAVWDEAIAGHLGAGSTGLALNGATAPAASVVADAVWDEAISGHLGAGSTGAALNAAGSAGDPWTTPIPGAYGAGTAGKIIGDNLNATVGSRAAPGDAMTLSAGAITAAVIATDAIDNDAIAANAVTELQAGLATASALSTVSGLVDDLETRLTAVRAGYLDNLPNLDAAVSTRLAAASYTTPPTVVQVRTEMDANSTKLANLDATMTSRASQTSVNTIDDFVDTEVGAIKTVTDKLDTAVELDGAVYRFTTNALEQAPTGGSAPTVGQIADAVWDEAIAGHLGVGSTGAALNGASAPSAAVVADAVWDEALAGHVAAGSTGQALSAAGAAADPLLNPVPGAYVAGTAGWVLGRLSPGAGSLEFTYTLTNAITLLPEANVRVEFCTDATRLNVVWSGYTDAFGVARDTSNNKPWLNPGTYYIRNTKGSNVSLDSEVVS